MVQEKLLVMFKMLKTIEILRDKERKLEMILQSLIYNQIIQEFLKIMLRSLFYVPNVHNNINCLTGYNLFKG